MTDISVGGVSTHHAPLEVNAPAAQQAAELDGHTVSKSLGTRISEGWNNFTSKISGFFDSVSSKYNDWKQARADAVIERQQEAAKGAASEIIGSLKDGRLVEAYQSFTQLHSVAENLQPENPRAFVSEKLQEAASQLSTQDREAIRLHDFKEDGERLVRDHSAHAVRSLHISEGLVKSGLMSVSDLSAEINFIEDVKSEIPTALKLVKNELKGQALADVRSVSQGLFPVADDGTVNTTRNDVQIFRGDHNETPGEVLKHTGENYLTKGSFESIDGVDVSTKAVADWPRSNINFVDGDRTHNTTNTGGPDEAPAKVAESVAFAREFTGSDEATKVLSSVVHQYGWRDLSSKMVNDDGQVVRLTLAPKEYAFANVHGSDGVRQVDNPGKQVGGAEYTVTKTESGDFKVAIDWELLAVGIKDENGNTVLFDPRNPIHAANTDEEKASGISSALSIQLDGEILISGEAAARGELELLDSTFEHTFTGKLTL